MRNFIALILLIFSASACQEELKKENQLLLSEKEQLLKQLEEQRLTIDEFVASFESIQENLAVISSREQSIKEARQEGDFANASSAREQVLSDLDAINSLMEENRKTIGKLEEQVRRGNSELGQFKKVVSRLQSQITLKDSTISSLKDDLSKLNFRIDQLNNKVGSLAETNLAQRQRLEEKELEMNTAYYTFGTYKELKKAEVVDAEGGFIGIGRTKTISDDFNKNYFTQIDIRKTRRIPLDLDKGKAELLSSHASESYKWEENEEGDLVALEVSNPEKFWESTRYLVILVK